MKRIVCLPLFALLSSCALGVMSSSSDISSSSEGLSSSSPSNISSVTSVSSSTPSSSNVSSSSTASSSDLSSNSSSSLDPDAIFHFGLNAKVSDEDFLSFFNKSTSVSLSLSFSNASLYALSYYGTKDNQKYGDIYFPADLTINVGEASTTLDEVGVRMKGNTSRDDFVSKEGTISQASHFKISFKATFDDDIYSTSEFSAFKHDWSNDASGRKARKKRRLYTMSKLDLKYLPRNDGATYSEEIFAYNSFLSEGIPAPYARWGKVHLSSESDSKDYSYELIETVDDDFIMRRFDSDNQGGDLYKCVWGSYNGNWTGANLSRSDAVSKVKDENNKSVGTRISNGRIGVEDNWNGYHPNYQLKTNDDGENSDFSKIANFINVIYDCRYGTRDFAELNSVLDLDEFLRFEAMSYLLGNFDDQRNNANNYYLYFLPTTGKAIYIP